MLSNIQHRRKWEKEAKNYYNATRIRRIAEKTGEETWEAHQSPSATGVSNIPPAKLTEHGKKKVVEAERSGGLERERGSRSAGR